MVFSFHHLLCETIGDFLVFFLNFLGVTQQEVSPRTSGRLSHSSGPLNGTQSCGSLTDSPPVSPSEIDDIKVCMSFLVSNFSAPKHRCCSLTNYSYIYNQACPSPFSITKVPFIFNHPSQFDTPNVNYISETNKKNYY